MGTNYYVEWNPNYGNNDSPASLNYPQPTMRFHICKNLNSFQGHVFNSWSAWSHFLRMNRDKLSITDEYGKEHEVPDFIARVEATTREQRSRQFDWVMLHSTLDRSREWLDAEGFSFYAGEFS